MIVVPTAWWAHYIGDAGAWAGAFLAARWQYRRWPQDAGVLARTTAPGYYLALALGALAGAWLLGSANSLRSLVLAPSHSVAGALVGGILAVELWKWRHGVRQSTGGAFVLPFCVGLALGRLGCLFSGLADFTYGTPTGVPWAVDFGDGIPRHPVQLYESLAMAAMFVVLIQRFVACDPFWLKNGFYLTVGWYGLQRFVWEFFKPYATLAGSFNLFHLVCLGLVLYAGVMIRRGSRACTTA